MRQVVWMEVRGIEPCDSLPGTCPSFVYFSSGFLARLMRASVPTFYSLCVAPRLTKLTAYSSASFRW